MKWSCSVVSDSLWPPGLCSLPGSSVHGIFQVRVLEWVAISFSRGTSPPRDQTQDSCIVGRRFTIWAATWVLATGKWQRYFVNPIYLTLYGNHLISAFYLPDLFHHLISSHLCAVVYVLLVAWHSPYSEEQGSRSAAESFPEVTTFNLLILQLQSASSIKENPREESRNLD